MIVNTNYGYDIGQDYAVVNSQNIVETVAFFNDQNQINNYEQATNTKCIRCGVYQPQVDDVYDQSTHRFYRNGQPLLSEQQYMIFYKTFDT